MNDQNSVVGGEPPSGPQGPYPQYGSPPQYGGVQPSISPSQPIAPQPPKRRHRLVVWLGIGIIVIVLIVVGAFIVWQKPMSQKPHQAVTTSDSGKSPPCAATPVIGPAHTLTLPQSMGGFQIADGPNTSKEVELAFIGNGACWNPGQYADYQNSQGYFVSFFVGHHANLWQGNISFFGSLYGTINPQSTTISPGPLGGQAACTPNDGEGVICTWYDSDTYGDLVGDPGMTPAQVASLLITFRDAVEQPE